ncbi:MAG: hypothetical protein JWO06_1153, partial [Bacteroidota bacterium]|nr:hypothetical protein [Bacteroidota bacterium]
KPSNLTIPGSPMIRLMFDSNFVGTSSMAAAIHETELDNENLSIFPNPTTGEINLKSSSNSSFDIDITNAMGQTVIHNSSVTDRLSLSELSNGVYLITARNLQTAKTYRSKIIKTTF